MKTRAVWLWMSLAGVAPALAEDPSPATTPPEQGAPQLTPDPDPTQDPGVPKTDEQLRAEMYGEIPRLDELVPGLAREQVELPPTSDPAAPQHPAEFMHPFHDLPPLSRAKADPQRAPEPAPEAADDGPGPSGH